MKVSIIIPCYNMGELLLETLNSALQQTYSDYEIIIINDGSNDIKTIEILSSLNNKILKIINIENKGLPAARNIGILSSKGRYICPLDSDDLIHPNYLAKTVSVLDNDKDEKTGIVTTDYRFFEGKNIKGIPKDFDPIALAVENCLPVTSLFRKRCWEEVGGYDESLSGYQDWNLWISIVSKGYSWSVIREELFYYRDRKNSMLKGSDGIRGKLAANIYDINRSYYMSNSEQIIKEYGNLVGNLRSKIRGLQEENRILRCKTRERNLFNLLKRFINPNRVNCDI